MGGFRLGSILGFEIRIDYSWFIIFLLILWTLGLGVFPASYPGQPTSTYIAMGAIGTLLFFASLIAHELSHSLVARGKGITVSGITLFVFGGMAHATMEFEDPADEFQVAAIGPISSLAIAGIFYLIGIGAESAGWSAAVVAVAEYLAYINLALAIFNLLPGFPLDGGRIFRAAAWKFTGDMRRATRFATNGGKVIGYVLIAFGFVKLFGANLVGGMWLVLIGWFIRSAAESSYLQLLLRRSLDGVRAGDAMTPDPYTVAPHITIEEFVDEHVFRGRHNAYPVVDDGHPVGIISLDRIRQVPREEWAHRTVAHAMAPADDAVIVDPDEKMDTVLDRLAASQTSRVLVARDGILAGIITSRDVARWLEGVKLREG
jgi:Zn-dependent protease/predicted transcriptional regulator